MRYRKSQWDKDIYFGEISNNKFKYFFRKAHTRNSFTKGIKGEIYEKYNCTYIDILDWNIDIDVICRIALGRNLKF